MMKKPITALVPMKGHSERIPNKNLKLIGGKPLFHWVIDSLVKAGIDRIVINTDSDEIAESAKKHFTVVIHERPKVLCGDFVSMNKIIEYDLSKIKDCDAFLQTHSTNPFLKPETIREAIAVFEKGGCDSVFSVTRYQSRFYDAQIKPINHDPANLIRTQDLPPVYEENSNFYLFSRASFSQAGQRIGKMPKIMAMNAMEAIDIDEPWQWTMAEALIRNRG